MFPVLMSEATLPCRPGSYFQWPLQGLLVRGTGLTLKDQQHLDIIQLVSDEC